MGAPVGEEPAPFYFLGGEGEEEQFPRPWELPTVTGSQPTRCPLSQSPALLDLAGCHLGWQTVPGSPQDALSNKSPTNFCPGALEEANQS